MKKSFSLVIAGFAMLAMASASFAANTANINVTSEPIRYAAPCDKAGGFAISFDNGTTFMAGDQITFDLDYGVTLCKDIDLVIGANQVGTDGTYPLAINAASVPAIPTVGAVDPITATAGTLTDLGTGDGVLFSIKGVAGSARVTINVLGIAGDGVAYNAGITNPESQKLILSFLDQTVSDNTTTTALFQKIDGAYWGAAGANYTNLDKNTLCINVSGDTWVAGGDTTVNANFDSKADKYTWIPSNPQVAHVVTGSSFEFAACKFRAVGNITIAAAAGQNQVSTCSLIDNESGANYCTGTHADNNIIIATNDNTPIENVPYSIEATILVNGVEGNNGVYWAGGEVKVTGNDDKEAVCDLDDDTAADVTLDPTYTTVAGVAVSEFGSTECTVEDASKAVTFTTDAASFGLGANDDYMYINLPSMVYDPSDFVSGDVLSVKISLTKAPCGEVFKDQIWELGTAGCDAAVTSRSMRFPYFAKTGNYANAIVITNLDAEAGEANLTLYESDGDVFTATVAVSGYGMYVNLLGNLTWSGTGIQGDAKGYVTVNTDFDTDGAAMITNPATGESIGYLPRLTTSYYMP